MSNAPENAKDSDVKKPQEEAKPKQSAVRKKLGFKGILISDDISMKALSSDIEFNAKKSLVAGCNLVLYCAGKYKESYKLLKTLPIIDKFTAKKTSEFFKFLR